jgi:universal stress protein A
VLHLTKVVCPLDFDDNSLTALQMAAAVAKDHHAALYLVHVARVPAQDMDAPVPFAANPIWEKKARAKLKRIANQRLKGNLRYEIEVRSGVPDSDIVPIADELGADLIVMATHGRSGIKHFFLGSVAESVTREAHCPVLIVKPKS